MLRNVVLILSVILFILNYQICEVVYGDNVNNWNILNDDITHLIILLCLVNLQLFIRNNTSFIINKWYRIFLYIGLGFTSSDVIDRWIFGIRHFVWTDLIMIAIVLITGYRKYLISKLK